MSSFRRVLETHPDGMQEVFHWNEATRSFAIEYLQNIDLTLTAAREEGADTGGWNKARDLRHVASVPPVAQMEMIRKYGMEVLKDARLMRRVLDDPDWRYLRVGKII